MINKPWLLSLALLSAGALAADDSAIHTLFQQADFWQGKHRQDLAKDALKRILVADPGNKEALYRLALIAIAEGNSQQAKALTAKLRQAAPGDPRLEELRIAAASTQLDSNALAEARLLAANGQYDAAVKRFQALFGGSQPPASLAVEYYQTLAGASNGWTPAKDGLAALHARQPNNQSITLAYGKVLTYRASTRRQGIKLLASLPVSANTDAPLRQGLLWLAASTADKGLYDQYLKRHPDDKALAKHYHDATTLTVTEQASRDRTAGYRHYSKGQLSAASHSFRAALAINSKDADAIAGLGLVALRQGQFETAKARLSQAMKLSPKHRQRWQKAYDSARFYGTLQDARELAKAHQYDKAQALVTPLASSNSPHRVDAQLLEADLQAQTHQLSAAADGYQSILQQHPDNVDAKVGLVNVLRQQERWQQASALMAQLPKEARQQLGDLATNQALMLRDRARHEPPVLAEATLRQALSLTPHDPWIRLDLAKRLNQQGRPLSARIVMTEGLDNDPDNAHRYVAAELARLQGRWGDVSHLLTAIPKAQRSAEVTSLLEQAALQARLAEIKRRQAVGDRQGAQKLILDLYNNPPASPAGVGQVAQVLQASGDDAMALMLARQQARLDSNAPPGDYLDLLLVMVKAGDNEEAQGLIDKLSARRDLSQDDWQAIEKLRNAKAVAEADRLRLDGKLADAYDLLAKRLRVAPDDMPMLLAMARLYQSGHKDQRANQLYQYLVAKHPGDLNALKGAVNSDLALGRGEHAQHLIDALPPSQAREPEMLLLAAQVAHANGQDDKALALLQRSRQSLFKDQAPQPWLAASGQQPDYNNPFRDNQQKPQANQRPAWLPGEAGVGNSPWQQAKNQPPSLVAQIDSLRQRIRQQQSPTLNAGLALHSRSGAAGLGKLDRIETPVSVSFSTGGHDRMTVAVTPTYLNSGAATGNNASQFGTSAIALSGVSLASTLQKLPAVLDGIEQLADSYNSAQQLADAAAADPTTTTVRQLQLNNDAAQAKRAFDQAAAQDLLKALGLNSNNLSADARQKLAALFAGLPVNGGSVLSSTSLNAFLASRDQLEAQVAQLQQQLLQASNSTTLSPLQHDTGLGLKLAYQWHQWQADIGTTPLGFAQSNWVGGVRWQPELSHELGLDLGLQRRPVTDSVLSYAGTTDPRTGKTWGGVTRNSLNLGLRFDNGSLGLYGSLTGARYLGKGVADNNAFELAMGGYLRPINDEHHSLQTGIHVSFMGFDKNLSYYTLGHGGYFSPQDYVSVAFPITYKGQWQKLHYRLHFAPGFQSFTQDAAPYFPTDPQLQVAFDAMAALGLTPQSQYPAFSSSGFGLNAGAQATYQINPALSLDGQLGYDSFGNYNELSVLFNLHYRLGLTDE
ncbi:cellulose synthase subunit BcsC-related outer membrane protein [Gallaecimonas sp. GXIMD1310]|uniref:cellulose biosynthesis protein BcsC n=1 Tax=Gallaecimonas sp. GXIMD1310 TaxID=3131926 RepID=UPI003251F0F3